MSIHSSASILETYLNSSSTTTGDGLIHFPESIITTKNSDQTIVTDILVDGGTIFGPYPGRDAVEKKYNNWMQYVTTVTDFSEANLVVAFCKNQLYFHCNRRIRAGTELIVWGGKRKVHLQDASKWPKYSNEKNMALLCQDCNLHFQSSLKLALHWNKIHQSKILPQNDFKCPHCPHLVSHRKNFRTHCVFHHGISLYKYSKNKIMAALESRRKNENPGERSEIEDSDIDSACEVVSVSDTVSSSGTISSSQNSSPITVSTKKRDYSCKEYKKTFKRLKELRGRVEAKNQMDKNGNVKNKSFEVD